MVSGLAVLEVAAASQVPLLVRRSMFRLPWPVQARLKVVDPDVGATQVIPRHFGPVAPLASATPDITTAALAGTLPVSTSAGARSARTTRPRRTLVRAARLMFIGTPRRAATRSTL